MHSLENEMKRCEWAIDQDKQKHHHIYTFIDIVTFSISVDDDDDVIVIVVDGSSVLVLLLLCFIHLLFFFIRICCCYRQILK